MKESSERCAVRRAERRDLDGILLMWEQFIDEHAKLNPFFERGKDSTTHFKEYLLFGMQEPEVLLLVAGCGGQLVGYGIAVHREYLPVYQTIRFGYIQDLYVDAGHRGMGIGRRLVERMSLWFREGGISRVEIDVVQGNRTGESFWRHLGFADFGLRLARNV